MSSQAVLPRRSRRLATIIPASHWISMGYSQLAARAMEELQKDMKRYCDNSDETKIKLEGRMEPHSVPHHDMMLPHWKKFFQALRHTSVADFEIGGICLPMSVLDIMFPAFQSMNLERITLVDVEFGKDELSCLSNFIKTNTSLTSLGIGGDKIDDLSAVSLLSDALHNHPTIQKIIFAHCGLDNEVIFEKILEGCTKLDSLSLGFENIGVKGVALMADFIRSNHPMRQIELEHCNITDNDTLVLATALKKNTRNLKAMSLENNVSITEEGDKTLLSALYDPCSMNSIVESNHTGIVFTFKPSQLAQRSPLEKELFKINLDDDMSIRQKIRKKVVLALCRQDGELFDLSHLNDLPLQLMPRVLELIQEHTIDRTYNSAPIQLEKDALSRLFHTLRGWELPLLFENLKGPSSEGGGKKRKRRRTRR